MSGKDNADYLMDAAMKAGITSPAELSNFMGQMQVESGNYARMSENLNYSGERLLEVFPGRNGMHTQAEANRIAAGGPEAIANAVYGGKYGEDNLGNTEPGDGWKFHGRGYVQLTGRNQYKEAGDALGIDLVNHPELAEDKDTAAKIAIHYWQANVQPSHRTDVTAACKDINGGYNGLDARKADAAAWQAALDKGYKPGGPEAMPGGGAGGGMSKEKAEHVQTLLNAQGYTDSAGKPLTVDGHAGKETKAAIERFQTDHQLKPDGVVGPATLKALEQGQQHTQSPGQPAPTPAATHAATPPAAPAATAVPHDQTIRSGANGAHVEALQTQLRAQGYVGTGGRPLSADGHYGPQTERAVEAFQQAHGLTADGVAGPKTLQALEANRQQAQPAAPSLADASHPSHDLYKQALEGVQGLDAQHGRASGPHTPNIAGSLTSAAVASGMTRVDQVVLSADASKAYAMQGAENSPFKQHAEVDVTRAASTPLAQSSAEALVAGRNVQAQQAQQTHQARAPSADPAVASVLPAPAMEAPQAPPRA